MTGAGERERRNVLVITYHSTRYVQAYITQSQTVKIAAKALQDNFIIHYGLLEKNLSDQERTFKTELMADLFKITCSKKLIPS